MKEKKNLSTYNMTIGAVLGAIVFILFLLKFPRAIDSIVYLVLGGKPSFMYNDPFYPWKIIFYEAFQFSLALFFIFTGVFLALCITIRRNEAWIGRAIKNIFIFLLAAPIVYSALDFIGMSYCYYYAMRLLGGGVFFLAVNFSKAMIGLFLSLFIFNFKQYQKGRIKFALAGLISGWVSSLLSFLVFWGLNLAGNDLRILVKNSQIPFTVACVGIVVMLMEKRVNRQLEKLATEVSL